MIISRSSLLSLLQPHKTVTRKKIVKGMVNMPYLDVTTNGVLNGNITIKSRYYKHSGWFYDTFKLIKFEVIVHGKTELLFVDCKKDKDECINDLSNPQVIDHKFKDEYDYVLDAIGKMERLV